MKQQKIVCVAISCVLALATSPLVYAQDEQSFGEYTVLIGRDSQCSSKRGRPCFEISRNGTVIHREDGVDTFGSEFVIGAMEYDEEESADERKRKPIHPKLGDDVTGEGMPDAVITEWTGGAYCCQRVHIFEIGPRFRVIGTIDVGMTDGSPFFRLNRVPDLMAFALDNTFLFWAGANHPYSPVPEVILRYRDGRYRVTTDLMRHSAPPTGRLRRDAAELRSEWAGDCGVYADHQFSNFSCWWGEPVDLIYTGHADLAWKFIDEAWPPKVKGKAQFLKDFRKQLAKSPYWPEIRAMNSM